MFRTALRNVLAHKGRLLMTTLAVILGTAFVAGTPVFSDTFGNALRTQNSKSYTDIAVTVSDNAPVGPCYDHRARGHAGPPPTPETPAEGAAPPRPAPEPGVVWRVAGPAHPEGARAGQISFSPRTNPLPRAC
ncbi:hypothetical protein VM98_33580, partial [Streptomyces rubellomurinus subsp. indigoferus]